MNTLLLLLLDSRAPAGAHHHSGGMEAAIGTGLVSADPVQGLADLEDFCRARLRTSARVSAAFAAAGRLQSDSAERAAVPAPVQPRAVPAESMAQEKWAGLDAEFEARTPSEATRAASRQLGGGLLRLLRSVLPDADLMTPWTLCPGPRRRPLVCRGSRVDVRLELALGAGAAVDWRELIVLGRTGEPPGHATLRWDVTRLGRPVLRQFADLSLGLTAGRRVLACALITGPALAPRTIVASPAAVAQRVDDHTLLVTVLDDDAARATRQLGDLCARVTPA